MTAFEYLIFASTQRLHPYTVCITPCVVLKKENVSLEVILLWFIGLLVLFIYSYLFIVTFFFAILTLNVNFIAQL